MKRKLKNEANVKSLKNDIFPKFGEIVNIYVQRIYASYKMGSNTDNLITITNFLKSFFSLPMKDFCTKMNNVFTDNQESFNIIYLLVNGDRVGVDVLLANSKKSVSEDKMEDYVKYMQNSATKRLHAIIEQLEIEIANRKKIESIQESEESKQESEENKQESEVQELVVTQDPNHQINVKKKKTKLRYQLKF